MKRRISLIFLLIIAVIGLTVGLTACSNSSKKPYDYLVTFNYNTEGLDVTGDFSNQYLGVYANSLIMQPCKVGTEQYKISDFKEKQIPRHEIKGWYTAKYDGDGKVETNADGSVVLEKEWDFANDKVNGDLTLYASLEFKPAVTLMFGDEVVRTNNYSVGTTVALINFVPAASLIKVDGHTFYGYYKDPEFTEEFTFPVKVGEDDVVIYGRYIEGVYDAIVKTAEEFNKNYSTAKTIYLDDDLDFTDVKWNIIEFGGEINGNGHVIKNITYDFVANRSTGSTFGLFSVLRANSYVHNVTFENVTVTVDIGVGGTTVQAALFAYDIKQGAKLENVAVNGSISAKKEAISLKGVCYLPSGGIDGYDTVKNCNFAITVIDYE